MFFANFWIFKLLVEYEDTPATERYFVKLMQVVRYTFCKRMVVHSMLKFDKNIEFWGYFWVRPHIYDAKTDPFILFGADLFAYLKLIGVQIIEKITEEIESCV